MILVDFPSYDFKVQSIKGKDQIFDPCRKKWVTLTPEEWVRQNVLQYLIQICKYPIELIAIEKKIQLGSLAKRFDILVHRGITPWMIIECKEANTPLNEKTILQLLQYQQALDATYLIASNGKETIGAEIKMGNLHMLHQFPNYVDPNL
ncbi:MAG: type I restriction enzyme HsdR N-terminal domain-containing protein [Chitinophagia bacterium]|jgi:hypothetical protein